MATADRPDPFPATGLQDFPPHVRSAFREWGRATVALRVYRRRGWNTSAVQYSVDRCRRRALQLLRELEDSETNPTLF